ncbi:hypothetical protein GOP47_0011498 [Adiantum capillus-veneris]|uniref:Uncharacterized protein n=1 Tax=Adiantum capillus-veneris TaxID=13818 RepID=A0A9D4USX5_ADICA|nr:hypothetical protein GOP47_0011498 [Adiantum capillus-veneris]
MTQRVCYEQGLQLHVGRKGLVETARGDSGGSPLPSWKLYENPFYDGLAAAVVAAASAAAAVAMAGKQPGGAATEADHIEEAESIACKKRFRNTTRASSASPPASRATLAPAGEHQRGEKGRWMQNEGLKAGASTMANGSNFFATSVRRDLAGRVSTTLCPEEIQGTAVMADENVNLAKTHRPTSMQGAFGNYANVHMMQGGLSSKDMKAGNRARSRATSKVNEPSGHGASISRPEPHREEASMDMVSRVLVEENTAFLDTKPMSMPVSCEHIESSCSPRSHLQPRPPSSNSDSPCSSKPIKAPKASTKSPQFNRSSQPISPPLKTITLMRPRPAGDLLRVRNSAVKSASSSHRSPLLGDDVEKLPPHPDNLHFAESGIITSPRDYLKALNRSRVGTEEKKMESSPVVSALSEELKRALTRVQELERFQTSARKEVDGLLKRFADEKALLRNREQEKIQAAVFSIEEELDKERKLRKKLESDNRKLSRSLADANKTVVKAEKELDKERKARQLMEDVCDELAREIGEDKAEVEELKREHASAREEMEEERRTLQMTEAWREERVQMKLSEAKYELEERCVALDKLKLELEMYLSSRQAQEGVDFFYDNQGEDFRTATEKLKADTSWSMLLLENGSSYAPQSQDDGLSSDEIHSLRLSRDNIRSQSEWAAYSDARVRDRAKWAIDYAKEESGRFIASDNVIKEESDKVISPINAFHDAHNSSSWFSPKPISRWGNSKASIAGLPGRHDGLTAFDDSDSGVERSLDEENGAEVGSNDADSIWGYAGENGFDNNYLERSKWSAEGDGSINALRNEVKEIASASEEERDSRAGSSPELGRRLTRGMYQNQGFYGGRGKHSQHALLMGARQNADDENTISLVAEFSPVYTHNANSTDFMAQREDWPVVPAYRSSSQGRRVAVPESSIPQGRRDLVQWVKPPRSNHSLQTTRPLDDRMRGLHLQPRQPKGRRRSAK